MTSTSAKKLCRKLLMAEESVNLLRDATKLIAEPALWVVGIRQHRGSSSYEDRGGLVVDTDDC